MKKSIIIISLIMVLISGCQPSESQIQTAIAETQVQLPATAIPDTATPAPTATPTLAPTITFTPSPTPDLRIIDIDPQLLLLNKTDLPLEGKYSLPGPGWMSINTNSEVIAIRGIDEGQEYVFETGRVVGWWVYFARGTMAAKLPEEIGIGVYQFKTRDGALLALEKYNDNVINEPDQGWRYISELEDVGEKMIVTKRQKTDSGGQRNTWYDIQFLYKNVMGNVNAFSYKEEFITDELMIELASKLLEKIMEAPLVLPENAIFIER